MNRSAGSYELVFGPLLLALVGYGIDRWLGTTPILTIMAAVIGLAGAVIKLYYSYAHEMDQHDAGAPWARGGPSGRAGGQISPSGETGPSGGQNGETDG
jgi:hypothetical protein